MPVTRTNLPTSDDDPLGCRATIHLEVEAHTAIARHREDETVGVPFGAEIEGVTVGRRPHPITHFELGRLHVRDTTGHACNTTTKDVGKAGCRGAHAPVSARALPDPIGCRSRRAKTHGATDAASLGQCCGREPRRRRQGSRPRSHALFCWLCCRRWLRLGCSGCSTPCATTSATPSPPILARLRRRSRCMNYAPGHWLKKNQHQCNVPPPLCAYHCGITDSAGLYLRKVRSGVPSPAKQQSVG